MNPTSKKFISLFLVFSLVVLSGNLYAKERRGAKLIITKKDEQLIEGELITVKPNSLLLLDAEEKDVSIDIRDIKVIRIVNKSKVLSLALIGSLGGAATGMSFGALIGVTLGTALGQDWSSQVAAGGAIGALVGVIAGAITGAIYSIDKTIQIEGMTDLEIQRTLKKLLKKARIRDYK